MGTARKISAAARKIKACIFALLYIGLGVTVILSRIGVLPRFLGFPFDDCSWTVFCLFGIFFILLVVDLVLSAFDRSLF